MDTKSIGNNPAIHTGVTSKSVDKADVITENEEKNIGSAERRKTDFNVSLSNKAQEILEARQKAAAIAKDTSPIREDRVAELRASIKNGTYEIDPGKIADGILKEAIRDELAKNPEA